MKRSTISRAPAPRKRRPPGVGCQARNGARVCRKDATNTVDGTRLCPKHAADRLFARYIRASGPCWAGGWEFVCNGAIQCCHIVTRARLATRWDDGNARPMCAGHHVWFTHNPDAWRAFVTEQGVDYDALSRRSINDPPMNPREVIARLEAA